MKPWGWLVMAAAWLAAIVLDQSVGAGELFGGAAPSFCTGVALAVALVSRPAAGALAGFISGLLLSAVMGANALQTIIPHVMGGFLLSTAQKLQVEMKGGPSLLLMFIAALVIRLSYVLTTSPSGIGQILLLAPVSSALTALAAFPVYALLSRSVADKGP